MDIGLRHRWAGIDGPLAQALRQLLAFESGRKAGGPGGGKARANPHRGGDIRQRPYHQAIVDTEGAAFSRRGDRVQAS